MIRISPNSLVYGLRFARSPQFVGAGDDLLACMVKTADAESDLDRGQLTIVDRATGETRPVSPADWNVHFYASAPDRDEVVLVEGPTRRLLTGTLGLDTSTEAVAAWKELAVNDIDAAPVWSPSASLLAVTRGPLPATGSNPQIVTQSAYKEDGLGVIGSSRRQLQIIDAQTGVSVMETTEPGGVSFPAWSPSGARVAVRIGGDTGWPWATLAVLDPAGSETPVFMSDYTGTVECLLFWDEATVIFVGSSRRPWDGQSDILRWNVIDDTVTPVVADPPWQPWAQGFNGTSASPILRRDERTLWVSGHERSRSGLYAVDVTTRAWERLHSSSDLRGGLAVTHDRHHAVQETSSLNSVGELSEVELLTGEERTLTHLNDNYFASRAPIDVTRLAVQRGDWTIDAWVLRSDAAGGPDAPLVLDVHGGPHNFWGEFFLPEHQALLEAGAIIVYCNPRGSGTYGPVFASDTAGRWGGEDTDDILAAYQAALSRLGTVPRTFISGWSYGGFQVLTILSRLRDTFTAAICGAPAADFISWYGSSDVGSTMVPEELGGRPFEVAEHCRSRSPSAHIQEIRTPLLLLHGVADMRSPIGQTELVHRVLSDAGVTVRYVRYPGAPHSFRHNGRPSHRAHVLNEIVSWIADGIEQDADPA